MAGYEVGSAFLTIMPSAKGFGRSLGKEIDGPLAQAGVRGGKAVGDGVAKGGKASFVGAGKSLGGAFAGAFVAMGVVTAIQSVGAYVSDAIGSASDLAETINKSDVIFGDNAKKMEKWAEGASKSAGLSKDAALDAASGFGNMFQQLGFAADDAAAMSTDVVQLSADMGSFNNLPTADVADKISAAFRGEYDSLQALIPNINAATVEQEALATTGKKSADELTAAEKAAAVLAIVHRDGAAAAGDFAATSDGLANSQKILKADMENVKTEIGTALLPIATDLFEMFRDTGVPIMQDLATWFTENKEEVGNLVFAVVDGSLLMVEAFLGLMEHMARMMDFWITVGSNMVQTWLNVTENIIDAAVNMFGWVPGVGDKLREVQGNFGKLRDDADTKFGQVRTAADQMTQGFESAQTAVAGIRDTIAQVKDKTVTISVKANIADALYQDTPGMYVRAPGRAGGGRTRAGQPYIVGEREAELFVPDTSGTIYNQAQLAAMAGHGGSQAPQAVLSGTFYSYDPTDIIRAGLQESRRLAAVTGMRRVAAGV